jgi:ribosome-binding factor A
MSQGSRPDRVGEELRVELSTLLMREVHDPGIGFITLTRVQVTPDLQQARVYYTTLGDDRARRDTARALKRAAPFLRRRIGTAIRLKRVPELEFIFDKSIEQQDRIEQLLQEIHEHDAAAPTDPPEPEEAPSPRARTARRANGAERAATRERSAVSRGSGRSPE